MRAHAKGDLRRLLSVAGLTRLLLVVLATPAVLLGAVLALACAPVVLSVLTIRGVARVTRAAHS